MQQNSWAVETECEVFPVIHATTHPLQCDMYKWQEAGQISSKLFIQVTLHRHTDTSSEMLCLVIYQQ